MRDVVEAAAVYGVACGTGSSPPAVEDVRTKVVSLALGLMCRCWSGSGCSSFTFDLRDGW